MEDKIRAILKAKGLRMSDLANRVGMGQSNLVASIRTNPKISTLENICVALGIDMAELLGGKEEKSEGIMVINGETYAISKPRTRTVQLPSYTDYSALREDIKSFVRERTTKKEAGSICGMLEDFEFFTLSYDYCMQEFENKPPYDKFHLTICYANKQIWDTLYDVFEYCKSGNEFDWDVQMVCTEIIDDIEGYVLAQLGKNYKYLSKEE